VKEGTLKDIVHGTMVNGFDFGWIMDLIWIGSGYTTTTTTTFQCGSRFHGIWGLVMDNDNIWFKGILSLV